MAYTTLKDGFKTTITVDGVTAVFEEVSINPPALEAGGAIPQTNMRNSRMRTFAGKSLVTLGEFSVKVHYDPKAYAQIYSILGSNRYITIKFPDNSTLVFYAIVDKFDPDELKEGDKPEASLTFIPSNLTTAVPPVEFAPVYATGTTVTTTTTTLP